MRLLIVGDGPNQQSGLGRIARDLALHVYHDPHLKDIEVAQLALDYDGSPFPWRVFPIADKDSWAEGDIIEKCEWHFRGEPGVILTVWDPGRLFGIVRALQAAKAAGWEQKVQLWAYCAIDAENRKDAIGGPVPEVLADFQRILGYGRWGAEVLKRTADRPVTYLPHGLTNVFHPMAYANPEYRGWKFPESWQNTGWPIIGVVATNQPRKDWGLVFEALAKLDCHLWVHTDQLITAMWSIPELAELTGRNTLEKTVVTQFLTDEELAWAYSTCDATIAPGLGEGFGYPIVESLACGTPVVHGDVAGGAELVPMERWRVPASAWRLEGPYALRRPVFDPTRFRDAMVEAVAFKRSEPEVCRAYCAGAVAHLQWKSLWSYWRQWIREGLR